MSELLYKQEKKIRGSKLSIYADGTIVLQGKTSKYGLHIPSELFKWKQLPTKKTDDKLTVLVDFRHKENKIGEALCHIYHNNYECYLRPVNKESIVYQMMKKNSVLKCLISDKINEHQQISSTNHFDNAIILRKQLSLPVIDSLDLLFLGGLQETKYEIFSDKEMNLYFRCRGKTNRKGVLVLSSEISRFIQDWLLQDNLCLCSVNDQEPFMISLSSRRRNSTPKIYNELNIPYYGEPKEVTVYFTVLNIQLSEQAQKDIQLKTSLNQIGFNIFAFKSHLRIGKHYNEEFEHQARGFIEAAFQNVNGFLVLPEVEIITSDNNYILSGRDKYRFDSVIYLPNADVDRLILVEIKTSIEPSNKCGIIESAIAKLFNYKERMGKNKPIPILIINEDLRYRGALYTKQFGDLCGVILIGRNELTSLMNNPTHLMNRINQYTINQVKPQPFKASILKTVNASSEGSEFENKVKQQLLDNDYKVQSNVIYRIGNKHMEIDHVAINQNEKLLISCKDHSKVQNEWQLLTKIIDELNIIAMRKFLLCFSQARLYLKTDSTFQNKLSKIITSKNFTEAAVFIL